MIGFKGLLLICALAATAYCVEPEVKTYEDLRNHLETFTGTTLVMFFDPEAKVDRKNAMIKEVNDIIYKDPENKEVKFMQSGIVVDSALEQEDRTKDPALMVDELELDLVRMRHAPTLAAFRNGWATWVHGDKSVQVLAKKISDFDERAKENQKDQS